MFRIHNAFNMCAKVHSDQVYRQAESCDFWNNNKTVKQCTYMPIDEDIREAESPDFWNAQFRQ